MHIVFACAEIQYWVWYMQYVIKHAHRDIA